MPLLRIADVESRNDDHGAPYEVIELINDELSGSDYSILDEPSRNGYAHVLVMEVDDE